LQSSTPLGAPPSVGTAIREIALESQMLDCKI